jgi:hypothetical protein
MHPPSRKKVRKKDHALTGGMADSTAQAAWYRSGSDQGTITLATVVASYQ